MVFTCGVHAEIEGTIVYDERQPDTLIATFFIYNMNEFTDPVYSAQLLFTWDTVQLQLYTISFDSSIFLPWGGLTYSIDSTTGECHMAGAGVTPLEKDSSGIAFTAYLIYQNHDFSGADKSTVWNVIFNETTVIGRCPNGVDDPFEQLPDQFYLSQNYPNPFNPTTTINFSLAIARQVSLYIYNVLGQEIKKVDFGYAHVGEHTFVWDGTDKNNQEVISGVYFYRLKGEQITEAKKMILLK